MESDRESRKPNEAAMMVLSITMPLAKLCGWVAVILFTFVAALWGFGIGWAILGGMPGLVTGLIVGILGAVLVYKGMAWFVRTGINQMEGALEKYRQSKSKGMS